MGPRQILGATATTALQAWAAAPKRLSGTVLTCGSSAQRGFFQPQTIRGRMIRDATAKNGQRPLVIRSQVCIATTAYKAFGRAMDTWCQHNCLNYPPNCPPDICTCPDTCKARSGL